MAARSTKFLIGTLLVVLVVGGGAYGIKRLWDSATAHFTADVCTVDGFDLDPDQASVAATMVGAVTQYRVKLPERATVLVLAAALQESKLTNLPPGAGDRDSVGVLQQRPSQGWGDGDPNRLTDVGEATKEFLDALMNVSGWQRMPLADAVQAVQISADGSAYAQHEPEAKALADALQGIKPAGITCSFEKPSKVAPATTVAAQASQQLGIATPTPVTGGVRVPGAHWQTAAWFVANADRLGIDKVAYDHQQWTRADGWRSAPSVSSAGVTATLARL